ncbi:N-acetylmuramoyl-L-alanine amidase [Streptomyces sp. NPDC059740]|uniref:N-acetylmuramoyl-L-alanine amidase n=1 Tax=Streptomyces sp. NPDC059740 TaxID=3346926 RepID=UPI00366206E4
MRRGPSRRGLLAGAGATVAGLGVGAYGLRRGLTGAGQQDPGRPVNPQARRPGAVDYAGARWVPAAPANWRHAARPGDFLVEQVVVHVVQGTLELALEVFQDPRHAAAAHYVVGRDGRIVQTVLESDVAFHAGNSQVNEGSIGIEHEGWVGRASSFTDAMYRASARLTATVCRRYGIPVDRDHVIGHLEVPGSDHTDPGPFWDWDRYLGLVGTART